MMEISATMVKQLREKTGAGIMDCKEALSECDSDTDKAIDFLRKKGLATAAKAVLNVVLVVAGGLATAAPPVGGTAHASPR